MSYYGADGYVKRLPTKLFERYKVRPSHDRYSPVNSVTVEIRADEIKPKQEKTNV